MVEIRLAGEEDIQLLEKHMPFGGMRKHRERFNRQAGGEVLYLIAWLESKPVGHLLLKWEGTTDEPMASQIKNCPDIEDLRVHPDYYRQGIGSRLMDEAEGMVSQKGFTRVGLSVGTDNRPAARMYGERGYRDAGFGRHMEYGSYTDEDGELNSWEEECIYLIKDLS